MTTQDRTVPPPAGTGAPPAGTGAPPAGTGVPPGGAGVPPADTDQDASVGQLISDISEDLGTLFRQEVDLAKAELRQEAGKAGKAAGALTGAGVAGFLAALLLSLAAVYGLGNVMDLGWAALLVAVVWAVAGAVLFVWGRKRLRTVSPMPRQTVETLKEDAQWLKHPTR